MKKTFISFCILFLTLSIIIGSVGSGIISRQLHAYKEANSVKVPLASKDEALTAPSTTKPSFTIVAKDSIELYRGEARVIELSQDEEKKLSNAETTDGSVITVDSGGRIDALKVGQAVLTLTFSDYKKYTYNINVKAEPKNVYDGYSTCIIANSDIINKNKSSKSSKKLYEIKVNRKSNCVTVYTYDKNGKYNVPVRAMVCSCGESGKTVTGNFDIYFKDDWLALYNDVYGHYISGFYGDFLFHSVPYYIANETQLEVEEFNKLGSPASLGCVRMAIADAKWVYDNCPLNTKVVIYDDDSPGPLGKPEAIKITDKNCGWDPTDPNGKNPYKNKRPQITGAADIKIKIGDSFDPMLDIKAVDTCSNDITSKIKLTQNVITSKAGTYKVTYSVTDAMHRSATQTVNVVVEA